MLTLDKKQRSVLTKLLLALGGGAYFIAFSQFNLHFLIRGYAMIIPLQIFALYCVLYIKFRKIDSSKNLSP